MSSPSRGASCPSFAAVIALESAEGAGKAGSRLAPAVHCAGVALQEAAQRHTGEARTSRPSLRGGLTAYVALSPGSDALLPPSPRGWLMDVPGWAARITTRLGAQTPGARTTRLCRTQAAPVVCARYSLTVSRPANHLRADAACVHHIPPTCRDDRDTPSDRVGWIMFALIQNSSKANYLRRKH